MPKLLDALTKFPNVRVFRTDFDDDTVDDPSLWELEPADAPVLTKGDDEYLVIAALHVLPDKTVRKCFMNMCLPERIADYAFFIERGKLIFGNYRRDFPGKILPAIAIDCFGEYELFFVKHAAEIGIEILQRGLADAKRKQFIAHDLGYIFRDLRRYGEAIEMFELMVAEDRPPSEYTYLELASAYKKLGDSKNEVRCNKLAEQMQGKKREKAD